MYLTFPEELIFGTQNYFRAKDKRTLSQLCLHAIFLSLFQCSQRLFHTSLRRIALRKSKLLFVSFFFQAVFYILWCHQAVYQEHYCTWLSLFSPDNILRVDKWSCFPIEGNVFIWILYMSLWNHDILQWWLEQQAVAITSVNP